MRHVSRHTHPTRTRTQRLSSRGSIACCLLLLDGLVNVRMLSWVMSNLACGCCDGAAALAVRCRGGRGAEGPQQPAREPHGFGDSTVSVEDCAERIPQPAVSVKIADAPQHNDHRIQARFDGAAPCAVFQARQTQGRTARHCWLHRTRLQGRHPHSARRLQLGFLHPISVCNLVFQLGAEEVSLQRDPTRTPDGTKPSACPHIKARLISKHSLRPAEGGAGALFSRSREVLFWSCFWVCHWRPLN